MPKLTPEDQLDLGTKLRADIIRAIEAGCFETYGQHKSTAIEVGGLISAILVEILCTTIVATIDRCCKAHEVEQINAALTWLEESVNMLIRKKLAKQPQTRDTH